MLEADTESGAYWKKCGDEALAHGVKGIIIMVSRILLCLEVDYLIFRFPGCSLGLSRRQNGSRY